MEPLDAKLFISTVKSRVPKIASEKFETKKPHKGVCTSYTWAEIFYKNTYNLRAFSKISRQQTQNLESSTYRDNDFC